ncbi:thermonuclease family protein [Microbacterium sp. SSM24]|uniref:thermonuclease family protein n=1 Tax=Microbacterium sp. SSM24 TaxID=2991714 RepID=UPI00222692ED|nr:thermonuclease family protein [Microbacterium sp. SSM24]MCW3492456.1 thermonuclease family protein [Microbacterium sp. SSM24]
MRRGVWAAAVVLGAAALIAVAIWVSQSIDEPGDAAPGPSATAAPDGPAAPERPAAAFPLTVLYVYDGDTIQARMQQPNDVVTTANPIRIRLIGVDTPEGTPTTECWADEARAHLAQLLPEGSTVWAAPDRDTWDDYDRRLFNLWTENGAFVNLELVAAGDAEAIRVRPNVAFYDLLASAQAEAEASGAGRWGACD